MKCIEICKEYMQEIKQIKKSSLPAEEKKRIVEKRLQSISRYIDKALEETKDYIKNGILHTMSDVNKNIIISEIEKIKNDLQNL